MTERHRADGARELAILSTALDLLSESGYERLSLDVLARQAHASKSTLYGKWGNKKNLVLAAIRTMTISVSDVDTGSLRGDLLKIAEAVSLSRERSARLMLAVAHMAAIDSSFAQLIDENLAIPYLQAFSRAIEKAIASGELHSSARQLTQLALVLPSVPLGLSVFGSTRALDLDALVDTVVLPGLKAV